MKKLDKREGVIVFLLGILVMGAVAYSFWSLFVTGTLSWHIKQRESHLMAIECVLLFILTWLIFKTARSVSVRLGGAGLVCCVFLWAHRLLVPVVFSGMYGGYLWILGGWIRLRFMPKGHGKLFAGQAGGSLWGRQGEESWNGWRNFLAGSLGAICLYCFMSAVGLGKIKYLWAVMAVTGAGAMLDRSYRNLLIKALGTAAGELRRRDRAGFSFWMAAAGAAVLTGFFIQAGRMNIAVDYDSIWYGVRSPYVLNNGKGIYENLGMIGIVYTYSKGFEVLLLPLSILPSYSFLISFNLWLAAGILFLAYRIGGLCMEKKAAVVMVVLLAVLPGIMNMSITAKSDIATLYFQLIMVLEMLLYLLGDQEALWYSGAAFFATWTLKPTAMVFSTAVMGMSGLYLIGSKGLSLKGWRAAPVLCLSLGALAGIWARTLIITGLPVTSVFSSLLTKVGFEMKYPFDVQKIPNNSSGLEAGQMLAGIGKRIFQFLFDPQGDDMSHVILAWGGTALWFFFSVWFVWRFLRKREEKGQERQVGRYLAVVFFPFLACNVISLIMLTQVDGNYFMLLHVLQAVYVFHLVSRLEKKSVRDRIYGLALPVIVLSVLVAWVTNWNWTLGFTPVSWRHKGFYNHQEFQRQRMAEKGSEGIWHILAQNPRNRVIVIGDHPRSLVFPCSTQSYLDITGTWGNVVLVANQENFVEFLKYADTDFIYVEAGYVSPEDRAWTLTYDLIQSGILVPECYEWGNLLARVDVDGQPSERSEEYLREFEELYVIKYE